MGNIFSSVFTIMIPAAPASWALRAIYVTKNTPLNITLKQYHKTTANSNLLQ
jgi:hypothetical protein